MMHCIDITAIVLKVIKYFFLSILSKIVIQSLIIHY